MNFNKYAGDGLHIRNLTAAISATGLLVFPWLNPFVYGPTPAVQQWLVVWLAGALVCLITQANDTQRDAGIRIVTIAWLSAAILSAVAGMLQYLGFAGQLDGWISYVEAGQAFANLRQRNQLATLLSIGIAALINAMVQSRSMEHSKCGRYGRLSLWIGASTLIAATDAATGSRTGLIQLLLLLVLAIIWKCGRRTMALVTMTYLIAVCFLPLLIDADPLHSTILGRFKEAAPACTSRLTLWENVLQLIAQKPWLGWGWGELPYAHFITIYEGPRFCEILGNAHNLPLHLAVSLGVPYALMGCGGIVWAVCRAKPWKEIDSTRQLAWNVLAVIGIHSLLEYPLWYGPFQLTALIAIWILWKNNRTTIVRSKIIVATALTMSAACSYGVWDYWRISQIYLPLKERAPAYHDKTFQKAQQSWLFRDQVKFAELSINTVDKENAAYMHRLALYLLHFSPEAMVVEKLIESDQTIGEVDEAQYFILRYKAAYPREYENWNNHRQK